MPTRSRFTPAAQTTDPRTGVTLTWCSRCDRYVRGADMVHVQDYGHTAGKRAGEMVDGDVLVWNFGGLARVRSVTPASRCFVNVNYEYVDRRTGEVAMGARRCKPDTLLATTTDAREILLAVTRGRLT